uniref:Putative pyridoxal phosphate-dependent deaminase n=1 Tax=Haliea sp. ETY-M TaxID=1055105 RepID=A0A455R3M9_9GAMM|nr:putative pyridoxal phosphate-dependent deaminase [Haliea sp. ETY-M]
MTEATRLPLFAPPTPLQPSRALAETLDLAALWFKRDDLIPFGFGGNKIRGLEWIVADALQQGADTLVTGAGVLSNHVRATASVAASVGLRTRAVYWGSAPEELRGNHLLVRMLGAEVVFTESTDRASVDDFLASEAEQLTRDGHHPYVIPRGGACPLGVLGHVHAVREVLEQFSPTAELPEAIVLAAGSGGTLTGWLLGSALCNAPWNIYGVSVSRSREEVCENVLRLGRQTAKEHNLDAAIRKNDLHVYDTHIGSGYGIPSSAGNQAITAVAKSEGIFLDPTYTGKAFAWLIDAVRQGFLREQRVLFVHSGGEPALFASLAEHVE